MFLPVVLPTPQTPRATAPAAYTVEHEFYGAMPTGVTVSKRGRVFVTFPRWGDDVKATVVELKRGKEVAYPTRRMNDFYGTPLKERFVSVQSVVVDAKDRLWALDTGSIKLGLNKEGAARLWCVNLKTDKVERVYTFPRSVVPATTYLNDVRFDLTRGEAGYAFITDSSAYGNNRLIVLNLKTGESRARLVDHPTVKAARTPEGEARVMRTAEGYPLLARPKPGVVKRPTLGADGFAIFPKADRLVWCPLIGRVAYEVPISGLINPALSDVDLAGKIKEAYQKPASDGLLELPEANRLLVTDYENAQVIELGGEGPVVKFRARRYEWPDTMAMGPNGRVFLILNQLQRQANYHEGKDLRRKPYRLVSFSLR